MNDIASILALAFDGILLVLLVSLAVLTIMAKTLFNSIVLMICFGLVMALAWVRLQAPDIALAEAALGAGVTGALLLSAMARLEPDSIITLEPQRSEPSNTSTLWSKCRVLIVSVLVSMIGTALMMVLITSPSQPGPLVDLVSARLTDSGVGNAVTAVLINFRGYDTLLEMGVLFLALLGSWTLQPLGQIPHQDASPFLHSLLMLSMPLLVLSACYLLWAGADHPGGAFQAGAVLAGAGVLLLLARTLTQVDLQRWYWRVGATLGLLVFISVAVGLIAGGGQLLQFTSAPLQIFLIELAAMFSIATTLSGLLSFGRLTEEDMTC